MKDHTGLPIKTELELVTDYLHERSEEGALSHSMAVKPKGLGNRFQKRLIKKGGQGLTPRVPGQFRSQGFML